MEVLQTYTLYTLKGPRHLFDDAWNLVCEVVRSAPGVLLTTGSLKRGWMSFLWEFELEGDKRQVEMVRHEINRRIDSYNSEETL